MIDVKPVLIALSGALGMLAACSSDFTPSASPAPATTTSSSSTSSSTSSSSSSGSNTSSSSSGGSTTDPTAQAAAVDGSWLITKVGDQVGAKTSLLTITNGVVTGAFVHELEGMTVDGCTFTKYRTEFSFTVSGNTLSGSLTAYAQTSGTGDLCFQQDPQVSNLSGTRTTPGSGLDGEYQVNLDGVNPFIVDISNLAMKAWDKAEKAAMPNEAPDMTGSVAGTAATNTSNDVGLIFTATKQ